jgi:hypothetical protein
MLKSIFASVLMVLATTFGLTHAPVAMPAPPTEPVTKVLTIVNHVSTTPITLLPNTRFETQDHLIFRVSQSVTIPAKHGARDGTAEVTVVATQPGAQYDIGSAHLVLPGLARDPALYTGVYAYISGAASQTQATAAVAAALPSTFPVPSGSNNVAAQKAAATRSPGVVSWSALMVVSDVQEPAPPSVLTTPVMSRDYVTKEELAAQLSATTNALRSLVYQNESAPNSPPASGGYTNDIAVASTIDHLNGVTLNDVTVNGILGLTAADVPPLSSLTGLLGISRGGTGTTTAPGANELLLSDTNGNWEYVATSSLGMSGGGTPSQWTTLGSNISFNTGNIGVGTTSPSALFTIDSNATNGTILRMSNTSSGGHVYDFLETGSANSGGAGRLDFFDRTAGAARLSIAASGNVGIGSTSPSQALSVQGNALVSGSLTLGALSGAVSAANGVVSAGTLSVGNGGTGSTTLSGVLVGNGAGALNTLTLPSLFSLSGTTLSLNTLGIGNGGTGTTTGGVANGIEYYNGSTLTNNSNFVYSGGDIGIQQTPTSLLTIGAPAGQSPLSVGSSTIAFYINSNGHASFGRANTTDQGGSNVEIFGPAGTSQAQLALRPNGVSSLIVSQSSGGASSVNNQANGSLTLSTNNLGRWVIGALGGLYAENAAAGDDGANTIDLHASTTAPNSQSINQGLYIDGKNVLAWSPDYNQNVGGDCYGHVLCWGDQNMDLTADHTGVITADPSVLGYIVVGNGTVGGATTPGDQIGIQWTIGVTTYSHYITAQSGDTSTTLAKELAASINGGAVSATVAGAGSGYTNGDQVQAILGSGVSCPTPPKFQLTVAGGVVTAATPIGAGGSVIQGGECITPPANPLSVSGGTGSGLTLTVTYGWTDITTALANLTDKYGLGTIPTAVYQSAISGLPGDAISFDMPDTSSMLVCPGTGVSCPSTQNTPLTFENGPMDNDPYVYYARNVTGRNPMRGDQLANIRFLGPATATSGSGTMYSELLTTIGDIDNVTANVATAAPCSGSCTVTINGYAGSIPDLPGTFTAGRWLIGDNTDNQAIASSSYITGVTSSGSNTTITFSGAVNAPGISAGDLLSIIDANNPVGTPSLSAATGSSSGSAAAQLFWGGVNGGLWLPGVNGNSAGDGSKGNGTLNLLGLYDSSTQVLDSLRNLFNLNSASTTSLIISGISNCNTTSALTTNASGTVGCGSISGGSGFPFSSATYGVSTSTTVGFTGGVLSTASSTFTGSTYFPGGTWNSSGFVGVGSSTPWGEFSINPNGLGSSPAFFIGSSTATDFVVTGGGNVGIGTTTPQNNNNLGANLVIQEIPAISGNAGISIVAGNGNAASLVLGSLANPINGRVNYNNNNNSMELVTNGNINTGTYITSSGNVGISTSSPFADLSVTTPPNASGAQSTLFVIASSTNYASGAATTTLLTVNNTGNATLAGTLTQNSDRRLKTNVEPLDASSSLSAIDALNPVSFNWLDGIFGSADQLGFLAQEVQQLFPQLVSTSSPTALTPDGTLGLNYTGLIAPIISAIQALSVEITSLESTITGFAESFISDRITAAHELCVGSTCVTPAQFQAMVIAAGGTGTAQSSPGLGSGTPSDDTASSTSAARLPAITINGDNPAIIQIGSTYSDLGATITGPAQDINLGINVSVDGGPTTTPDQISIDTSTSSTHTISYFATDQGGETGYATRTVIVEAATSTP